VIRYWDASAVVPLLMADAKTQTLEALRTGGGAMATWWGTPVECASAIARMEREGSVDHRGATLALRRLSELRNGWIEVAPGQWIQEHAMRLLRIHVLRAADAFQLAAAILASRQQPSSMEFVCLDKRLVVAAEKEGFRATG
jgi:predicted nucleic acid-binding protein